MSSETSVGYSTMGLRMAAKAWLAVAATVRLEHTRYLRRALGGLVVEGECG